MAEGFQRRKLKCEKLTDDGRQVMAKTHIAFGKEACLMTKILILLIVVLVQSNLDYSNTQVFRSKIFGPFDFNSTMIGLFDCDSTMIGLFDLDIFVNGSG
jgi:hypothetical protein